MYTVFSVANLSSATDSVLCATNSLVPMYTDTLDEMLTVVSHATQWQTAQ